MPITVSPYYQNPQIGQIASNLATAIYGDPEARAKNAYYGSEVEKNTADTRKLGSEADIAGGRYKAQQAMTPEAMQTLAPLPGESAVAHAIRTAPLLSAMAQYSTDGKNAADASTSLLSNLFTMGTPDEQRQGLAMQGKVVGKDFAGSRQESDQIAARDAGYSRRQATDVANIDQAGALARTNAEQSGQLNRLFATPLVSKPGEDVYLAPSDPRRATIGKNGVIEGAPTVDTVRGRAGERILNGNTSPTLEGLFAGNAGLTQEKLHPVTGKGISDAIAAAASSLHGPAVTITNGRLTLDDDFFNTFGADDMQRARDAASTEMARSGNVQQAGDAFLATLGVKPGSTYNPSGWWKDWLPGGKDWWGHATITSEGGAPAEPSSSPLSSLFSPSAAPRALAPAATRQPIQIKSDADYAALPPGTLFVGPDGQQRRKRASPGSAPQY